MKEFLEFVVGQLVDHPDECVLRVNEQGDAKHFLLTLPPSEVGKVIGKQGHTINAIRNLLASTVSRQGGRISFEIEESSAE